MNIKAYNNPKLGQTMIHHLELGQLPKTTKKEREKAKCYKLLRVEMRMRE